MAGTVDIVHAYTGLVVRDDCLWFDPALPTPLTHLDVELHYREHRIRVQVTPERFLWRPARGRRDRSGLDSETWWWRCARARSWHGRSTPRTPDIVRSPRRAVEGPSGGGTFCPPRPHATDLAWPRRR